MASARPAQAPGANKWKVLISIIFGIFMIILDTTVVNVALRTIQAGYNVSLTDVQWIISVYVLALGITTPLSGFLADRFGAKRIYILGLGVFVTGSLLCGLSPFLSSTIWLLVAARAIQGIGGGLAQPLGPAFLYSTFPPEEQGTALGFFGIALVAAPALGPILGGLLVDRNLWEWIFFINVPIGILGFFLASAWLPARGSERKPKADPLGVLLVVVGLGAVLFASTSVAERGWDSPLVLWSFVVGAIGLVLFALVELFVASEPLLDLRLFKRPTFLTATLIGYVTVIGLFGAEFLLPLYLQVLRGRGALETGLILLPLAITSGFATPIAGKLYDKIGPRVLVMTGFGLLMINTWQLAQIEADTPISTLLWLLALRGVALGLTIQTTFATALGDVPRQQLARGSSLLNGSRFMVQSIGVAILATVLTSALTPEVKALQNQARETQQAGVSSATPEAFGICETPGVAPEDNIPAAALAQINGLPEAQAAAARGQLRQGIQNACDQYVAGFERTYLVTFFAAAVAVVIAAFMPGWPGKWAGRGVQADAAAPPAPRPAAH